MEQRDINLIIEDFKMDIIDKVNQSDLPISVIYYIFKNIFDDLTESYTNYINKIRAEEQQKASATESEESSEVEDKQD